MRAIGAIAAAVIVTGIGMAADLPSGLRARLDTRGGVAIALDAETGRLLAAHRLGKAATRLARPGSAIKPFVLMALLESGVAGEDSVLACRRKVRIDGRNLDCTHVRGAPAFGPAEALAYSCNWCFSTWGERLPPDVLASVASRFGLTAATGLAESEAAGSVSRPANPSQRRLQALGEWGVVVTPLGLAAAYRRLAQANVPALVREGLESSVEYGTSQWAAPPGVRTAGKTGTTPGENGGAWLHAWFAGWAPADAPKVVVAVFLENGRGGPDAAPLAREIFAALLPPSVTGAEPLPR